MNGDGCIGWFSSLDAHLQDLQAPRTNHLAILPHAWGGSQRVRGRRESPLCETAWVASSCLLFPCPQLRVQNQRSCDKPKFLENTLYTSGKLEVKLWPIMDPKSHIHSTRQLGYSRFPSEPQPTGNTDAAFPRNSPARPSPAQRPLPRGP